MACELLEIPLISLSLRATVSLYVATSRWTSSQTLSNTRLFAMAVFALVGVADMGVVPVYSACNVCARLYDPTSAVESA